MELLLPDGRVVRLQRDVARRAVDALWDAAHVRGAPTLAVALAEELSVAAPLARAVQLSELEESALHVLFPDGVAA